MSYYDCAERSQGDPSDWAARQLKELWTRVQEIEGKVSDQKENDETNEAHQRWETKLLGEIEDLKQQVAESEKGITQDAAPSTRAPSCPWCGNREGIERVIEEVAKEMRVQGAPDCFNSTMRMMWEWADRLEGKDE